MSFIDWILGRPTQLDRVESTLARMEKRMSQQEHDLDVALLGLTETVAAIGTAVDAVLTKLSGIEGVDLSDETAALASLKASLDEATGKLTAATTSPEPGPEPEPEPEPDV